MSDDRRDESARYRLTALLGIFFGLGFVLGFLSGYIYLQSSDSIQIVELRRPATTVTGEGETAQETGGDLPAPPEEAAAQPEEPRQMESELALDGDYLGEDENGFFIGGVIINRSSHAFDAVRITFDLCDSAGESYYQVWDNVADRMESGDSWGFTIYIPYPEMSNFDSYRLHSIMGVTR